MIPLRSLPTAAVTIARTFGVRGAALRAVHEARRRGNWFRSAPRVVVDAPPSDPHPFRVDAERLARAVSAEAAIGRGERVLAGEHESYRARWVPLPRGADAWLRNPKTGHAYAADRGWWHTPHLSPAAGDIKDVWEPARFGWAYDLVRAYLLTRDDRYAAAFHEHFGSWRASSPPFRGVHWSCGQEAAIRAIALLYAEANLADAPASTPNARAALASVLAATGERIADAIGYGVSQRNNHGISEAAGLLALGLRFRGAHPEATSWVRRGRRLLERLVVEQFAPDGWYIQHSFTYLRLAADQCVVAERALRAAGERLGGAAANRLRAAAGLLLAVVDGPTGVVPNHGASDGAFVHPVTSAPYRDFRPVLTALAATFGVALPEDVPADAEVLAWLGLPAPDVAPPRGDGVWSGESGWAAARVGATAAFLRAGTYRSRPSHLDPLQLDLRVDGRELVVDAGTFAYQAPPPWRNPLVSARYHNGPVIDGAEPGVRGPRFLWLAWPAARLEEARLVEGGARLVGVMPGRARRSIRVTREGAMVDDEVLATDVRRLRVAWLLHPDADPAKISCSAPARLVAATEGEPQGWFAPCYGERVPAVAVVVETSAAPGAHLRSWLGAAPPLAERRPGAEPGSLAAARL